jgi:hypothetical protein
MTFSAMNTSLDLAKLSEVSVKVPPRVSDEEMQQACER